MTNPNTLVTVTQADGIPVVTLPERRMTTSGKALADAILAQANSGNLQPASKEQIARAVGAAVGHHSYAESHTAEMAALRSVLRADDDDESPADVLENVKRFGDAARQHAATKDVPVITNDGQNGVAVALGGAMLVTAGSSGSGNAWVPGSGAATLEAHIEAEFPDPDHPIRRLWAALENQL